MKKTPELRTEYDFSPGVRGRYAERMAKGSNVVVLDEDVQRLFPDSAAVNAALRALGQAVAVARPAKAPRKAAASKRTTPA
jgi:hypothetical protein